MSDETPPDIQSGMIMKVLRDNPMKRLQSAVIGPGVQNEYPACSYLIINRDDFGYFAEIMTYHNFRLNFIKEDSFGNKLYSIDKGSPIVLTSDS